VADLAVNFRRIGDSIGNLLPKKLTESLTQAMDGAFNRLLTHAEPAADLDV
jgi:hypothetical protein